MTTWNRWVKRPFLRAIFELPWFGPLVSGVVLAMILNMISEVLADLWGVTGVAVAVFGMLVLIFLIVYAYYIFSERKYLEPTKIISKENPSKRKGLIVLVSNEPTLLSAIRYHEGELKCCWLIVTQQAKDRGFLNDVRRQVPPEIHFEERGLQDEYDAKECYAIVRGVYQDDVARFGLEPKDVIADITGGTKPMTMGMALACIEGEYPVEHVPAVYDDSLEAIRPLAPIEISYDIRQIGPRSTT